MSEHLPETAAEPASLTESLGAGLAPTAVTRTVPVEKSSKKGQAVNPGRTIPVQWVVLDSDTVLPHVQGPLLSVSLAGQQGRESASKAFDPRTKRGRSKSSMGHYRPALEPDKGALKVVNMSAGCVPCLDPYCCCARAFLVNQQGAVAAASD